MPSTNRRARGAGLAGELQRALAQEELFLEYQPIFRIDTGHIEGVEALVRWMHPERGRLPPGAFIPVANETGLIKELGYYVLRKGLADFARLRQRNGSRHSFWLSVNVSPVQLLSDDFACHVGTVLREMGASGDELVLEVTEDVLTPSISKVGEKGEQLPIIGLSRRTC